MGHMHMTAQEFFWIVALGLVVLVLAGHAARIMLRAWKQGRG